MPSSLSIPWVRSRVCLAASSSASGVSSIGKVHYYHHHLTLPDRMATLARTSKTDQDLASPLPLLNSPPIHPHILLLLLLRLPTKVHAHTKTPQPSPRGLFSSTPPKPIPFPRAAHGQPLTLRPALPLLVRHTLPVRDNGNMRHIVIISPASERASARGKEKVRLPSPSPRSLGSCRMH